MPLHELELLAPAGKMDVLQRVVAAGADAVYLGGKQFSMRRLNNDFNFTHNELAEAVDFVHQRGRKIYITVNNLYNEVEINAITDYLYFLQELGVDAFIIQDLGIVDLCAELKLQVPLHGSVQMGISNLEAVRLLEDKGLERVILSRNLTLAEIAVISRQSHIGIEHFIHGELCISHSGQCYMSSFTTNNSGNQGRCSKPCRWSYNLQGAKNEAYSGQQYFLAPKDMCLYPYLAEMIKAGVSSFKIEGRMRTADYLAYLVARYRKALDRFMAESEAYRMDQEEWSSLQEHRIRDFCTGNIWGAMDREAIGFDGQKEPVFISTPKLLTALSGTESVEKDAVKVIAVPELTVRVGGLESFKAILPLAVDNIILGGERFRQNQPGWTPSEVSQAMELRPTNGPKIFLETPRIVSQHQLPDIQNLKQLADNCNLDGLVVNDLGSFNILKDCGRELWAGYGLNTFNHRAAAFLQSLGIQRITGSLELGSQDLQLLLQSASPVEIMVQGPLPGIISDYCVVRAAQSEEMQQCANYCVRDNYALVDSWQQKYKIYTDYACRNYLFSPYEICLFPYLLRLSSWGARSFRIDGQFYPPQKLIQVVSHYGNALAAMAKGELNLQEAYAELVNLFPEGLTGMTFMSQGD